jgi:purine nucleosidase
VTRTRLIIDCDPGVDDAIALLLAFASPELDLLAVTTVAGNIGGRLTERNGRLIRQIAGREDVPVYAGAEAPLSRAPVAASHIHGESGLGTLAVSEPSAPLAEGHAANAIVELVMAREPGAVTIAAIGPLTNLALALRLEPALAARLGPLVVMGGARREGGNITPSAEFNVFADPHAAQAVFASGCAVTVLGLDATHQVRTTPARLEAVRRLETPAGRAAAELLGFAQGVGLRLFQDDSPPLHDPCTIAWLLAPQLFTHVPAEMEVETGSALTLGHTAVNLRPKDPASSRIRWVTEVDADGLYALLLERLAR